MRRLPAAFALLLLVIAGCGDDSSGPSGSLVGRWQLDAFEGPDGRPVEVSAPERFTVAFDPDGRVTVRADCNTCAGTYRADAGSLTIGPQLACTRAACPSAPLDQEYVTALAGATSYVVAGSRLAIFSTGGVLRFSRLE